MRRRAFALATLLVGCDAPQVVALPEDVAYVALLDGPTRSPLLEVGEAASLLSDSIDEAILLGYRADQLAAPSLPIDGREPLGTRAECGLLPPARGAGGRARGALEPVPVPSLALAASWMEAGCPRPALIAASCRKSLRVCSGPPVDLEGPCAWSVGCNSGPAFELRPGIWPGAPGCVACGASRGGVGLERWSEGYRARVALDDDVCVVDAGPPPPEAAPIADVITVQTGPRELPETLSFDEPYLDNRILSGGGVTSFLLDRPRRRAIVAVSDDVICPSHARRSKLRTIDLDTLEVRTTSTATLSGCLVGLTEVQAEPQRLIALSVGVRPSGSSTAALSLWSFDAQLRRAAPPTVVGHVLSGVQPIEIRRAASGYLALLSGVRAVGNTRVLALDVERRSAFDLVDPPLGPAYGLEIDGEGEAWVLLRDSPDACKVPRTPGPALCRSVCTTASLPGGNFVKYTSLARDPADGAAILGASANTHGVFGCETGAWIRHPSRSVQVSALWPLGPRRALAAVVGRFGAVGDERWSGRLTLVESEIGGFEPRSWTLPGTVVSRLVPDGDDVWAVLPYDGVVVRWRAP